MALRMAAVAVAPMYTPSQIKAAKVTSGTRVDHAHHRHRQVADDKGNRQAKDRSVH
jgi:hypothetical protein